MSRDKNAGRITVLPKGGAVHVFGNKLNESKFYRGKKN
jgi:hypothetical protein